MRLLFMYSRYCARSDCGCEYKINTMRLLFMYSRYCARSDCGCEYKIKVRLLGEDKETELDTWEFSNTLEEGTAWTKARGTS